jgi:hypothetical protein
MTREKTERASSWDQMKEGVEQTHVTELVCVRSGCHLRLAITWHPRSRQSSLSIVSSGGECQHQAAQRSSEHRLKLVGRIEVTASPVSFMVEFSWHRSMLVEPMSGMTLHAAGSTATQFQVSKVQRLPFSMLDELRLYYCVYIEHSLPTLQKNRVCDSLNPSCRSLGSAGRKRVGKS